MGKKKEECENYIHQGTKIEYSGHTEIEIEDTEWLKENQ